LKEKKKRNVSSSLTFLSYALLYTFELGTHVWVGDCYKEPEIREPQIKLNKQ